MISDELNIYKQIAVEAHSDLHIDVRGWWTIIIIIEYAEMNVVKSLPSYQQRTMHRYLFKHINI